ncbi:LPXTG cell wall anchor domain-containing protein [Vagococcus sp. BWB3-3]|uniref:LPXTG cell wall anchor domain-containing protein n=1 Tax=Vagococcus allomyrinae TaxID=2794353 RepID=A0A940SX27_9ENTE|nr:LPXTG cell wall anchor domain-containing protein [Vagococcus allomyrinae]MBP1043634.1 LPXTG cell wall anchor domain-containing protein [Vagococcus allomyrinae]
MKKMMFIVMLTCLLGGNSIKVLADDSEVNSSEVLSTEQTTKAVEVETSETSEVANSEEVNLNASKNEKKRQDIPDEIKGNWVANFEGETLSLVLGDYQLITDGIEYVVTGYTAINNVYTIVWDQDAYIAKYGDPVIWSPQPFMFTYKKDTDTLETGSIIYYRQGSSEGEPTFKHAQFIEGQNLPTFLEGTWSAQGEGSKVMWIISGKTLNVNGVIYEITAYGIDGNDYTLYWDEKAYTDRYGQPEIWSPQPFIFSFDSDNDIFEVGLLTFHREVPIKTEVKTDDEKQEKQDFKKKTSSLLPKTDEENNLYLSIFGWLSLLISGGVLLKKNS